MQSVGLTQAKRSFVSPDFLRKLDFRTTTTLRQIEPHRLRALILEDLRRYPGPSLGEIRGRVGIKIGYKTVKRALDDLVRANEVEYEGEKRGRRYRFKT